MVIKWVSPELGFGVFAKRLIKQSELVGRYTGIVTRTPESSDYAWSYQSRYFNGARRGTSIATDGGTQGNYLRFVNHVDKDFNSQAYFLPIDGIWHTVYIAKRDIQPGEQITVHYGSNYFSSRPAQ